MEEAPKYRLGLDLGTNSIGWCAVLLDGDGAPCGVLDGGVRILTPNEAAGRDPQSKQSLSADRRAARAMRRRRDRFLRRQKRLMETLIGAGLMPADESERKALEKLDPYWLRAAALDERLDLYEIGRAIFHLNQRRGFFSNRIADADESEKSAMKAGMRALEVALNEAKARTLGEFLARRHGRDRAGHRLDGLGRRLGRKNGNGSPASRPEGVRFRPHAQGNRILYDFYPTRGMIEQELEEIWKQQKQHHPELTDDLLKRLKRIIIAQRPLKKPLVGRCTFRPEEDRAPRALPLFQRFRILSEIAALEVERPGRPSRKLSLQERDALANLLSQQTSTVTFEKVHRALKLTDDAHFNLERGGRKGLDPDRTAAVLAKTGKGESFGKAWRGLSRERQNEIVEKLLTEPDEEALVEWLVEECGLPEEAAMAASSAHLPQGHGHIGRSMLADLLDVMENEHKETTHPDTGEIYARPLTYDEAVQSLGLHHSKLDVGACGRLPYYGEAMVRHVISNPTAPEGSQERIGRVPNPTVHIALNQVRMLVNTLIDVYGPPAEIVLELARELKQSEKQKAEATRRNRENEAANERRRNELRAMGLPDTHGNRLLLRLYDELPADERVCVYTGTPISREMLFSGVVDIDHILPRSRTLDDSFLNKVLCTRKANRLKGNRPPAEVWTGEELRVIAERAERLFRKKAWRFAPDAMEKFAERNDCIARYLTDSQHMARLAKEYLGHLYGEDRNRRVWVTAGRLTGMLRSMWGLNGLLKDHNRLGDEEEREVKNRDDHRHHMLDAFVIACTDRRILQRIATAAGRAEELDLDRWAAKGEFPEPFEGFREQLAEKLEAVVISHKPDHGPEGQLHEETAYGLVDEEIDGKTFNLVTRKPIHALTEREIGQVRDIRLREVLEEVAFEARRSGEKLNEALARYGAQNNIRRVRVLKTDQSAVAIAHGNGRFRKAYVPGDNHRLEIFETDNGDWNGEAVTVFDANRKGFQPRWMQTEPRPRLVMRVHKGDLVEADFGEGRSIYRVVRLEPSAKRIRLVSHRDAGNYEARHKDPRDPFRWNFATYARLKEAGAQRVRVDPIGRVTPVEERP